MQGKPHFHHDQLSDSPVQTVHKAPGSADIMPPPPPTFTRRTSVRLEKLLNDLNLFDDCEDKLVQNGVDSLVCLRDFGTAEKLNEVVGLELEHTKRLMNAVENMPRSRSNSSQVIYINRFARFVMSLVFHPQLANRPKVSRTFAYLLVRMCVPEGTPKPTTPPPPTRHRHHHPYRDIDGNQSNNLNKELWGKFWPNCGGSEMRVG